MKKIVFFFSLFVFVFSYDYKFVNIGFGSGCKEDKCSGVYFKSDMGFGYGDKRIYLSLENIYFGGKDEFDVFDYSLNLDKVNDVMDNTKLYYGGGINYICVNKTINDKEIDDYKFGFNAKAGILYNITTHWALNLRGVYTYINHKDVKYTYGATLNLEYQF